MDGGGEIATAGGTSFEQPGFFAYLTRVMGGIPLDEHTTPQEANRKLHKLVEELTAEKNRLLGSLHQATSEETWLRQHNVNLIRTDEELAKEHQLLTDLVTSLQGEVELRKKVSDHDTRMRDQADRIALLTNRATDADAKIKAGDAKLKRLVAESVENNARMGIMWLCAVKDAFEEMSICLSAGISQDRLRTANCRGISDLETRIRSSKKAIKDIAFRETVRNSSSGFATHVEAAVKGALQELLDAGVVDEDVWEQVARDIALDISLAESIVHTAIECVALADREQLFIPKVAKKAHDMMQYYGSGAAASGRSAVREGCVRIDHPDFKEINAEDLLTHAKRSGTMEKGLSIGVAGAGTQALP